MPWIISPWNGNVIEVSANSPLLQNAKVVSGPSAPPPSTPAPASPSSAGTSTDPREKRRLEFVNFNGWDNNPAVRALQVRDNQIYIDTGKWNTPEQVELHRQAEDIRKTLNPTYGGSATGPRDYHEADAIFPRDTTPQANGIEGALDGSLLNSSNWGGMATIGLGIGFLMLLMSMFRR
jgi:hypothetical protein